MSHKPMSGGQYRETSQHDEVGELSRAKLEGSKDKVDKGAAKFWAKRGMMDPSRSNIVYGKKLKEHANNQNKISTLHKS